MHSTFTAFFDANVFFGVRLRSLCVEAAGSGHFRARWSADVHREWINAVVRRREDLRPDQLHAVAVVMDRAMPDAIVMGYEPLIASLDLPDPDDRHILAAAIVGRADVIVTFNEADFPRSILAPLRIHTRHPDDFLMDVEGLEPGVMVEIAKRDLAHYKRPALSLQTYADDLKRAGVPKLAEHLSRLRVLFD